MRQGGSRAQTGLSVRVGGDKDSVTWRLGSSRTVKVDLMNLYITIAKLALFRKRELNGDSTATLVVGDISSHVPAGSDMMAGRAIRHVIDDEDISVPGS